MSGKTLMATGKWAVGRWLTDTECIFVGSSLLCVFLAGMLVCVHARFCIHGELSSLSFCIYLLPLFFDTITLVRLAR